MTTEHKSEIPSNIKGIVEGVEGVAKAVPVYQDALQPMARQVGTSLETIAKSVNAALAPLRALVWSWEQVEGWLQTHVAEKLRHVPPERIISPAPNVAGPAIEALKFTGHCEPLRDLYANLLARSMDVETAGDAHPAFVEIIRQLTPDEAKIVRYLAGCSFNEEPLFPLLDIQVEVRPEKLPSPILCATFARNLSMLARDASCEQPSHVPVYIDNLCRLGILSVELMMSVVGDGYDQIKRDPDVVAMIDQAKGMGPVRFRESSCNITPLGMRFLSACVDRQATLQPPPKQVEPVPTSP